MKWVAVEIKAGRDVPDANNAIAAAIRGFFSRKGILAVNFMSSPGSGGIVTSPPT